MALDKLSTPQFPDTISNGTIRDANNLPYGLIGRIELFLSSALHIG